MYTLHLGQKRAYRKIVLHNLKKKRSKEVLFKIGILQFHKVCRHQKGNIYIDLRQEKKHGRRLLRYCCLPTDALKFFVCQLIPIMNH